MKIKIIFILLELLIFNLLLYSEDFIYNKTNIENAYKYYNSKNYIKAAELFEYEINNSPILKIEYFEILANISICDATAEYSLSLHMPEANSET